MFLKWDGTVDLLMVKVLNLTSEHDETLHRHRFANKEDNIEISH